MAVSRLRLASAGRHIAAFPRRTPLLVRYYQESARQDNELPVAQPVSLSYDELKSTKLNPRITEGIKKAFGPDGLGLLVVKGVPGFKENRDRLMPLGFKLAGLSEAAKKKIEHPTTTNAGWVHGRETFKGQPDLLKGYFTANPQYNKSTDDQELIDKYPEYMYPNMWPKEIPELESAFMTLGQQMVNVGLMLAKHCDLYVSSVWKTYKPNTLHNIIKESKTCKARLLHYFPQTPETADREWCGWHNDHGALTALASAQYFDKDGKPVAAPDQRAGLVASGRKSATPYKINIAPTDIAYQIGECAQILSGGVLKSTPHMVRGPSRKMVGTGIGRTTYAVFMQPNIFQPLDMPTDKGLDREFAIQSSPEVPQLSSRWHPGNDFATFTKQTFQRYFEMGGDAQ